MNWQLLSMIWSIAATVLVGVLIVIALVSGFDGIPQIIAASVIGALIAIPVALVVSKKLSAIK